MLNETTVTKILPNEKRIWVKTIARKYFDNLKDNGWKVHSFSDTQGKQTVEEVGDVPIFETFDGDT